MPSYLANTNTKEIHKLSKVQLKCKIDEMKPEHKRYLDYEYQVDNLVKYEGYNGCHWCYPEKDNG